MAINLEELVLLFPSVSSQCLDFYFIFYWKGKERKKKTLIRRFLSSKFLFLHLFLCLFLHKYTIYNVFYVYLCSKCKYASMNIQHLKSLRWIKKEMKANRKKRIKNKMVFDKTRGKEESVFFKKKEISLFSSSFLLKFNTSIYLKIFRIFCNTIRLWKISDEFELV